jgi:hypothetical protein
MSRITEIELEQADRLRPMIQDIHRLLDSDDQPGPAWAGMMWYVLARLERPLREHIETAAGPDSEVDQTRNSLVRKQDKLTENNHNLLEQCQALKWQLYRAAQPCAEESLGKTPPLQAAGDGGVTPDYQALKERVRRFVAVLESCQNEEASLVLESVTTDLGAGD